MAELLRRLAFLSARPVRAATGRCRRACGSRRSFYPRDPCGPRRGVRPRRAAWRRRFYPRDPCGPRLGHRGSQRQRLRVSIRATRAGRDVWRGSNMMTMARFLSARPVRAATRLPVWRVRHAGFYPRDPCGPRPLQPGSMMRATAVSIRATRAGRDAQAQLCPLALVDVSIRATRAGRDYTDKGAIKPELSFLSARPVRAATRPSPEPDGALLFLSARPVRAATLSRNPRLAHRLVSIRATRAGRDAKAHAALSKARGVSIRATRAGRD